jgi:hypothetical protein
VTWCSSAVNRSPLFPFAASCTRSSPLGSLSRFGVRHELGFPRFSLAGAPRLGQAFPPQPPAALPVLRSAASQVLWGRTTPHCRSSGKTCFTSGCKRLGGAVSGAVGLGRAFRNGSVLFVPPSQSYTRTPAFASPSESKARTVCVRSASTGLCGGCWVTGIPTATAGHVAAHLARGVSATLPAGRRLCRSPLRCTPDDPSRSG